MKCRRSVDAIYFHMNFSQKIRIDDLFKFCFVHLFIRRFHFHSSEYASSRYDGGSRDRIEVAPMPVQR